MQTKRTSVILIAFFIPLAYVFAADSPPTTGIFTELLNDTQKAELHSILFSPNATRKAIKSGVAEWVKAQNETIQEAYEKHQQEKAEWKKVFLEVHGERIAKLSATAKDLDAQLMAVWADDNLSIREACEKINALIQRAPDFVVKELYGELRKCKAGDPDHALLL